MRNISPTYRIVAAALVLVFAVFTIGVPVVLASCPLMSASKTSSCKMCCPAPLPLHGESLGRSIDASCCKTVIAAGHSTVEYERTSGPVIQQSVIMVLDLPDPKPAYRIDGDTHSPRSSAALQTHDIPILVSSLLI